MKMHYFLIFVSLVFLENIASAQCSFLDVLPSKMGKSKVQSIIEFGSNEHLIYNEDRNAVAIEIYDGWEHYDYLENDSVFIANQHYIIANMNCFKGNENQLHLFFADDNLYRAETILTFEIDKIAEGMKNYHLLDSIINTQFLFYDNFITTNSETNEEIGKSKKYYYNPKSLRDPNKVRYISIAYYIDSKYSFKTKSSKQYFEISISQVDLRETKLTRMGY